MIVHQTAQGDDREHPKALVPVGADYRDVDLSGVTVLVVDDEPDARGMLERVLGDCSARVLTAGNADEALVLLKSERPHVLVSDIGMPGVDGYELLRRARTLTPPHNHFAAIALTAFARSEDRTRALRAGFLMHLSKPVDAAELLASVSSVMLRTGPGG
jgi:CheY-like chemotaxis protein